ncbi:Uncharacterised protein [Vibrio cholerae]|nr:Uncharacterised protein [Vibrio cholerae]
MVITSTATRIPSRIGIALEVQIDSVRAKRAVFRPRAILPITGKEITRRSQRKRISGLVSNQRTR